MRLIRISDIKREEYHGMIYDLETNNTHTYNIDNIVVGNCSSGLHGVGITAVNALSDKFVVTVKRDGKIYRQSFCRAKEETPVEEIGKTEETGTSILYHPDNKIFKQTLVPSEHIRHRLEELTYLNAGLMIKYHNELQNYDAEFLHKNGIAGYVENLSQGKALLFDTPISINGEYKRENGSIIICNVSFVYDDDPEPSKQIKSFANNINTFEGGYHVQGFKMALRDVLNEFGIERKLIKEAIELKYYLDGIYAVVSVKISEPEFEGQTKTKLGSVEAQQAVYDTCKEYLRGMAKSKKQSAILETIVTRASKVKEAEIEARKVRSLKRKTSSLKKVALPGKLSECINKNGYRELFLVEGDSAAGSAKEGRDRRFQSILPLRGKILNVNKADLSKALESDTIKNIISVIGAGVGKTFDIDAIRYDKVIMMCDSDVDGNHIRSLLLTFFCLYMPELIKQGHVYAALPPLYRIVKSDNSSIYLQDDGKLKEYTAKHKGEKYQLFRFKGLGEMSAAELSETTMDLRTRTVKRIVIEDTTQAANTLEILMGKNVAARRKYIENNIDRVAEIF